MPTEKPSTRTRSTMASRPIRSRRRSRWMPTNAVSERYRRRCSDGSPSTTAHTRAIPGSTRNTSRIRRSSPGDRFNRITSPTYTGSTKSDGTMDFHFPGNRSATPRSSDQRRAACVVSGRGNPTVGGRSSTKSPGTNTSESSLTTRPAESNSGSCSPTGGRSRMSSRSRPAPRVSTRSQFD